MHPYLRHITQRTTNLYKRVWYMSPQHPERIKIAARLEHRAVCLITLMSFSRHGELPVPDNLEA